MSKAKEIPDDLLDKGNEKSGMKPKALMKDMQKKPEYTKNREYDKHSGTGRGKEIAKNGGGGKFTWGTNEKTLEKEAQMEEDDYDDYEEDQEPEEAKK